ncbi:MAG: hypothetical protein AAGC95_18680 [Pseudomonadota bacterium]
MTLKSIFAGAASVCLSASMASAGELADMCVASLEAEGRDTSGCACLEEQVMANDLLDEFVSLGEISDPAERYAAASDAAKEVMDTCTRS